MNHLVDIAHSAFGEDGVQLYTTDGGSEGFMSRGTLNGSVVYSGAVLERNHSRLASRQHAARLEWAIQDPIRVP